MLKNYLIKYALQIVGTLAVLAVVFWLFYNPVSSFTRSVPGMDKQFADSAASKEKVKIGETFKFFKEVKDQSELKWTRFRGENFDNISSEKTKLIDKFGAKGPQILWKVNLGEGHAAPVVYDGRVYLLDYIEAIKSDALRCFSITTGEELWQRTYKVHVKRNHGLSRTVPAVTDKYVVTIGPRCHVMCVDRLKGDFRWGIDVERDYKSEVPFWYTGQCPLIENDTLILATGGNSLLIGVDCKTGKKVWETPNKSAWKMSHSSIMPMTYKGKRMYIYCAIGGIVGVSAQGADKGQILWQTTEFAANVIAPSPLVLQDGKIFVTAGYGAGGILLQIKEKGGVFSVEILQQYKAKDGLASEQQTPILQDGYIYGILPKDAGANRNQFVCCRPNDFQKFLMTSAKTERFGLGPYILADGKFFILDDDGELTIAKASPTKFTVLDKAKIIDGQDSWGPLVITGGYLLMRDSKTMVCLDIKAK